MAGCSNCQAVCSDCGAKATDRLHRDETQAGETSEFSSCIRHACQWRLHRACAKLFLISMMAAAARAAGCGEDNRTGYSTPAPTPAPAVPAPAPDPEPTRLSHPCLRRSVAITRASWQALADGRQQGQPSHRRPPAASAIPEAGYKQSLSCQAASPRGFLLFKSSKDCAEGFSIT